ncbi:MAG: histidine phosphatase family protein [Bryobacteraceae bacterium]
MSTLTLVRHGQAQADRLTEIGRQQARALAAYWGGRGEMFDEVYTGSLGRHRETERAVAEAYGETGRSWANARVLPELNEYDADGVLRVFAGEAIPADAREFQRVFEVSMTRWVDGPASDRALETWPAFRDRVRAGLAKMMAGPAGRRVVAFTSGGPVGTLVAAALGAPDRAFLELNWRVRNTSLTTFVFSGGRFTLDSFNALPHVDDEKLMTFR